MNRFTVVVVVLFSFFQKRERKEAKNIKTENQQILCIYFSFALIFYTKSLVLQNGRSSKLAIQTFAMK